MLLLAENSHIGFFDLSRIAHWKNYTAVCRIITRIAKHDFFFFPPLQRLALSAETLF